MHTAELMKTAEKADPPDLSKIRFELAKGRNVWSLLMELKLNVPVEKYMGIVNHLARLPLGVGRPSPLSEWPKLCALQFKNPLVTTADFGRELAWATADLTRHLKRINSFRESAVALASLTYWHRFEECVRKCDRMFIDFGFSVWLMSARVASNSRILSLEEQKIWLNEYQKSCKQNFCLPISFLIGQRSEASTTFKGFAEKVANFGKGWDIPTAYHLLINYWCLSALPEEAVELADLLAVAGTSSAIDLYECVVAVITRVLVDNISNLREQYRDLLKKCLNNLSSVRDPRIASLQNYLISGTFIPKIGAEFELSIERSRFSELETSKSSSLECLTPFSAELIPSISAVLKREDKGDHNIDFLKKIGLNFGFTEFGCKLIRVLPLAIEAPWADPARILAIDSALTVELVQDRALQRRHALDFSNGFALLDFERHGLHTHEDTKRLYELFGSVEFEGDIYDYVLLSKYLSWKLIEVGLWWESFEIACKCIVRVPNSEPEFDVMKIAGNRVWHEYSVHKADPRLTIFSYLCSKKESGPPLYRKFGLMTKKALTQLLLSRGISLYSLLLQDAKAHEVPYFIYLLRYCCTPDIMIGNPSIASSQRAYSERIEICRILIERDALNRREYLEEIKEITFAREVEAGVHDFDKSRVYVNDEGLKRWARDSVLEDFIRYRTNINTVSTDMIALQEAVTSLGAVKSEGRKIQKSEVPALLLSQPKTEYDLLLFDIVRRLTDQFMQSPIHGLDTYLSTRIRHGSLVGTLLGPIEEAGILAKFDESTCSHLAPKVVMETAVEGENKIILTRLLAKFSDHLIKNLNRVLSMVHVRSSDHPSGVFEASISVVFLNGLKSRLTESSTFDDFMDIVFFELRENMDIGLRQLRKEISDGLRSSIFQSFEQLSVDANCISDALSHKRFLDAIVKARTGFANAVDRVAGWFTPGGYRNAGNMYNLRSLVEIACQVLRNANTNFSPAVNTEIKTEIEVMAQGGGAFTVADALIIVLDNAWRHSGLGNEQVIQVRFETIDLKWLEITTINDVAIEFRTPGVEAKLEEIRSLIGSETYGRRVRMEGGSGLLKLTRIGSHGDAVDSRQQLKFGFDENSRFMVSLRIQMREQEIDRADNE